MELHHRTPPTTAQVVTLISLRIISPPESEAIGFDDFPEFTWVVEKIEEWLHRIGQVFQQDPKLFRLLVYMPKLKEGDTTPDPQTWCNGFVEGMAYHREKWEPLLSAKGGSKGSLRS